MNAAEGAYTLPMWIEGISLFFTCTIQKCETLGLNRPLEISEPTNTEFIY